MMSRCLHLFPDHHPSTSFQCAAARPAFSNAAEASPEANDPIASTNILTVLSTSAQKGIDVTPTEYFATTYRFYTIRTALHTKHSSFVARDKPLQS
jgi:hypothetical protein